MSTVHSVNEDSTDLPMTQSLVPDIGDSLNLPKGDLKKEEKEIANCNNQMSTKEIFVQSPASIAISSINVSTETHDGKMEGVATGNHVACDVTSGFPETKIIEGKSPQESPKNRGPILETNLDDLQQPGGLDAKNLLLTSSSDKTETQVANALTKNLDNQKDDTVIVESQKCNNTNIEISQLPQPIVIDEVQAEKTSINKCDMIEKSPKCSEPFQNSIETPRSVVPPTNLDLVVCHKPSANDLAQAVQPPDPVALVNQINDNNKDNLENRLKDIEDQICSGDSPIPPIVPKRREKKKESKSTLDVEIKPRFANFLTTTSHSSLVKSADMEETMKRLSEGSYLWKVRGVNKCYNRQYKVDKDSMSLVAESRKWWSPGGFTASVASEGAENAVPIVEIVEIREGWKTDAFNKIADHNEKMKEKGSPIGTDPEIEESLCFSVIHDSGREVLDLMANSKEEREVWITGLRFLKESVQSLHQDRVYDIWLRRKFETADKDKNGVLAYNEVCNLLTSLNLKLEKKHTKTLFDGANTSKRKRDGEQVLDSQEFVEFYHSLLKMTEIENLYAKYCNKESKVMGAEELLSFFRNEQGLKDYQLNQVTNHIQEFELSDLKQNENMSFDGFYHLLLSETFSIYNIHHQKNVHQDMTQPLAHYYISSSHNTYLVGHQLAGVSSVEGYISALKKGCRVVELDLWDGDEGEPIIYHGHTLTTKITLADVLRDAIKLYAFTASPYPVILSIENHLSIDQQVIMVKLFKQILADNLLTDPIPHDLKALPSPEDLKYKIIIKAKKPQGIEIEEDDEEDDQDTIDFIDSDTVDGAASKKAGFSRIWGSFHHSRKGSQSKKRQKTMAPELAQVVNICEGKKFVSFGTSSESDKCFNFPSLRENKAKSLLESSPDEFIKFTKRQIAKIYPLGTRTDSSNLKPYPFWSVGAQVVTLNMQTEDKAMFYNDALFRSNGNCGYVLKPDILIGKGSFSHANPSKEFAKVLRVKIISAQHLPPSEKKGDIVDPYIQMKVRGHPLDKQKQRTKTLKNNGFNPVWNETLEAQIKVPDVALIYFTVRDESTLAKDPVLALAGIPFRSICSGYRHVHLTNVIGRSLSPAAIFVHVSVTDS